MLNGKAIARALRGHFIVDAALNAMILAYMFNVHLPKYSEITKEETEGVVGIPQTWIDFSDNADLKEAAVLYDKLIQGSLTIENVTITRINKTFQRKKESLKISRTAIL